LPWFAGTPKRRLLGEPGTVSLARRSSAGLCPGLQGLPASFAGRARHAFFGAEKVKDS